MDISCVVCGEPWDSYGVRNGDMLRWEADLFKKGAGCPCCEGVKPEGMTDEDEENVLADRLVFNPDEDGDLDLIATLSTGECPVWERPEPEVVKACMGEGCRVRVVIDPDDGEEVVEGKYGSNVTWHTIGEHDYCDNCATECNECGCSVYLNTEGVDVYDVGWSHPVDYHGNVVCSECYDTRQQEGHTEAIREVRLPMGADFAEDMPDDWAEIARSDVDIYGTDDLGNVSVRDEDVLRYLCEHNYVVCDGDCGLVLTFADFAFVDHRWRCVHECKSVYENIADIGEKEE